MASQLVKQFRHREVVAAVKNANLKRVTAQKPLKTPNPFLPRLNPATGRWAPPKYSLRRQAELVKKAKETNTLHLLPAGPKLPPKDLQVALQAASTEAGPAKGVLSRKDWWQGRVEWEGEVKERKVPGADVGNKLYAGKWRMFKGHKWQRTMEQRTKKRKGMLQSMKGRIVRFKTVRSVLQCMLMLAVLRARLIWLVSHLCFRRTSANDRTRSVDHGTLGRAPSCRSSQYAAEYIAVASAAILLSVYVTRFPQISLIFCKSHSRCEIDQAGSEIHRQTGRQAADFSSSYARPQRWAEAWAHSRWHKSRCFPCLDCTDDQSGAPAHFWRSPAD